MINFMTFDAQVLDNLPHDLVHRETSRSPWMEKWVLERTDGYVVVLISLVHLLKA